MQLLKKYIEVDFISIINKHDEEKEKEMLYTGLPLLTNCSISSLKGCRCSSEETLHTFSISEVHTGKQTKNKNRDR